jgi:hypothetical protein
MFFQYKWALKRERGKKERESEKEKEKERESTRAEEVVIIFDKMFA